MKIAVVGAGYVGFSNAMVIAQQQDVTLMDVDAARVQTINDGVHTLGEAEIASFLATKALSLRATADLDEALTEASFVLIATPTDYDPDTKNFDTSSVESSIEATKCLNASATIVIKSTVPVGFTDRMCTLHRTRDIIFVPEFLREGHALYDCLNPTRIVIGSRTRHAADFAQLYASVCNRPDVPVLFTGAREAEAIKLFANSYLALRVAYFNEIDTYAITQGLSAREIVDGVCLDPRIGDGYNNPSFGYGGYCLPKDTKQLLADYSGTPQNLISAVIDANDTRKDVIASDILRHKPAVVGIFRLAMKSGSDNFRSSAIFGIIERLLDAKAQVVIYEPTAPSDIVPGCEVISGLAEFKRVADVIVANRNAPELNDVATKVYTRDLYHRD